MRTMTDRLLQRTLPPPSTCQVFTTVSTEPVIKTSRPSSRDHATDQTLSVCAGGRAGRERLGAQLHNKNFESSEEQRAAQRASGMYRK
eukprot:m.224359 g.224359  ORF g.224359 m.224359 type:complete len:88 (-) comp15650_c1_seq3:107-370(-)